MPTVATTSKAHLAPLLATTQWRCGGTPTIKSYNERVNYYDYTYILIQYVPDTGTVFSDITLAGD